MSSSDKCLLICFIQFSFLFSSLLLSSIFWLLTFRQMYHKYCPSFCRIFSNCWVFHLLYKLFYFHEILLVYFCFFWCALERLSCSYQYPEFFFCFLWAICFRPAIWAYTFFDLTSVYGKVTWRGFLCYASGYPIFWKQFTKKAMLSPLHILSHCWYLCGLLLDSILNHWSMHVFMKM